MTRVSGSSVSELALTDLLLHTFQSVLDQVEGIGLGPPILLHQGHLPADLGDLRVHRIVPRGCLRHGSGLVSAACQRRSGGEWFPFRLGSKNRCGGRDRFLRWSGGDRLLTGPVQRPARYRHDQQRSRHHDRDRRQQPSPPPGRRRNGPRVTRQGRRTLRRRGRFGRLQQSPEGQPCLAERGLLGIIARLWRELLWPALAFVPVSTFHRSWHLLPFRTPHAPREAEPHAPREEYHRKSATY